MNWKGPLYVKWFISEELHFVSKRAEAIHDMARIKRWTQYRNIIVDLNLCCFTP